MAKYVKQLRTMVAHGVSYEVCVLFNFLLYYIHSCEAGHTNCYDNVTMSQCVPWVLPHCAYTQAWCNDGCVLVAACHLTLLVFWFWN